MSTDINDGSAAAWLERDRLRLTQSEGVNHAIKQ